MSVPNIPQPQAAPSNAPVQAPQNNDEKIGSFARGFLQELNDNDDPEALDPDAAHQEAQPDTPTETDAPEQEAETPALPEVPMVEIDVDGEKFTIPEKVKHRVMADKDYRQKTMEVAATKKHLEALTATAANLAQQAHQMAPYHAELHGMDSHAQYLDQQLRSGALNDDPLQFNRVQGELAILLRNRDAYAHGLQQQTGQYNAQLQQLRTQQLAIDAPKLFEQFPDLKKPEVQQQIAQYVRDEGLPQEAVDFLNYSATGVKIVQKARLYDLMVADQAKSRAQLKETVKSLPSTQSSRAPTSDAKDKQLRDEWKKNGGKINDPAFDQLLRSKIRR